MRTKHFLTFAAITAALASCTSDNFDVNPGLDNGGMNGKLVQAGLLGMGRTDGVETRAMDDNGYFIWMPEKLDASGNVVESSNQKIGFCWVGTNTDHPEFAAATEASDIVFTNYLYEHVGWLDKNATGVGLTECIDEIQNGAFIHGVGTPEATWDAVHSTYIFDVDKNGKYSKGSYTKTTHQESTGVLHLGSGLFKTENTSVFEGDYLVYFPYTDRFTKGSILANVPSRFAVDLNSLADTDKDKAYDKYDNVSKYSFAVGYVSNYAGGNDMEKIQTKNVNGYLNLVLKNADKDGGKTAEAVDVIKVIYYSPSQGFIYENDLSSKNVITALQGDWTALANEKLYATTNVLKTNSIYVDVTKGKFFETDNDLNKTMSRTIAVPALPQQIDDMKVYIVRNDQKSIEVIPGTVDINSGSSQTSTITVNLNDYKDQWAYRFFAVDEVSLYDAVSKVNTNGSTNNNTIYLLRDIEIANVSKGFGVSESYTFDVDGKPVVVKSMYENDAMGNGPAKIILKQGAQLTIKSSKTLSFDVDFVVEGYGCCGDKPALLTLGATTGANVINFNKTLTNNGSLAIYSKYYKPASEFIPAITINELVNEYDTYAISKNKDDYAANVIVGSAESTGSDNWGVKIAKLTNKGMFTSFAGTITANADNTIKNGIANTASKRYLKSIITNVENEGNNKAENSGKILVKINTMITSSSVKNVTEPSLIQISGEGNSETTDARYDITGASKNEGTIENFGVINFTGANLDNNGLMIDRVTGQLGGKFVNNGRGEQTSAVTKTYAHGAMKYTSDLGTSGIYVVQVDKSTRLAHALKDAVLYPSSVIVEFIEDAQIFNMNEYAHDLVGKDVIINAENVTIDSYRLDRSKKIAVNKTIGDCLTVKTNKSLIVSENGEYNTTKDVIVEKNAKFDLNGKTTIGNDLKTSGTTTTEAVYVIKHDLNVIDGTFASKGNNNVVENNYNQTGGAATFAANTTTTINKTFHCTKGTFNRLAIAGHPSSRATVNVSTLGNLNGGSTDTAWPTETTQPE